MTLFFLLAALLVLLALAFLLSGPLRARAADARESDLRATNIALARERREELAAALASGALDADSHERETAQLERDLAAELDALPERAARDGSLPAVAIVAVFVPLAAGALYLQLGDPGAVTRDTGAPRVAGVAGGTGAGVANGGTGVEGAEQPRAPAIGELLPRLEERLAREPGDVEGWRLLGRSYLGIDEFERAESALRRAVELEGDDIATLGQLAEAIAMARGGDLSGEPAALLDDILAIAPNDAQGLWLRAIAYQQAGEHDTALAMFARLRADVAASGDTGATETIDAMMARSLAVTGGGAPAPSADPSNPGVAGTAPEGSADGAPADPPRAAVGESGGAVASVSLTVDLSPEARDDARPDETVFVYARASDGPPMPLAVARYTVADLPVEVTLDESMAMMPAMSLASFPAVTVGARVSKSGNAIAASGDWFAEREDVTVGEDGTVALLIDARRP